MKILITADLHLNIPARSPRTGLTNFEAFLRSVASESPDAVVVAGDIGTPERSPEYLSYLRKVVGERPLAFCLGNHDHWLPPSRHSPILRLSQIRDTIWEPSADAIGAVLLDLENAYWDGVTICGGYGHFDLGLVAPGLRIDGETITRRHYLSGGLGGRFWNDFAFIPHCASRLDAHAREQAAGIGKRLSSASASAGALIVVTHTCPWRELNAHPLRGGGEDLFTAYSGNSLVGDAIARRAEKIDLLVCGHTHMPVREQKLHGVRSLNVGTDYGIFRGVVYDTGEKTVRWIGEPF